MDVERGKLRLSFVASSLVSEADGAGRLQDLPDTETEMLLLFFLLQSARLFAVVEERRRLEEEEESVEEEEGAAAEEEEESVRVTRFEGQQEDCTLMGSLPDIICSLVGKKEKKKKKGRHD